MNVVFSDLLVRHEKRMEIDFSALHDLINGGKNEGKLKTFSLKKFCHFNFLNSRIYIHVRSVR